MTSNDDASPTADVPPTRVTDELRELYWQIGLLPMAQDLWMQANGSADPMPDTEVASYITWFEERLANWRERDFGEQQNKIDNAVREILLATVAIARRDLTQRYEYTRRRNE